MRIDLTQDTTFYVSPAGDDVNDGLAIDRPKRTLQAAWNDIRSNYDARGFQVKLKLADGTYTEGLRMSGNLVGALCLQIEGNPTAPFYTMIKPASGNAIWAEDGALLSVKNIGVGGGGYGFFARQHAIIDVERIVFDACGTALFADTQCHINSMGGHWIIGDMYSFVTADRASTVRLYGTSNIMKPVNIGYFVLSYRGSLVEFEDSPACGWSSLPYVTGLKYVVYRGGAFEANGKAMPGTEPGVNSGGSFYP